MCRDHDVVGSSMAMARPTAAAAYNNQLSKVLDTLARSMASHSAARPASSHDPPRTLVVSAPGKVLLAGGYLVLDPANVGLVVAVDKRFYTTIRCIDGATARPDVSEPSIAVVVIGVRSPQFGASWLYTFHRATGVLVPVPAADGAAAAQNAFVEKTLRVALLYLSIPPSVGEISLTVEADAEFYGAAARAPQDDPDDRPRFDAAASGLLRAESRLPPVSKASGRVSKTGLGSSACLVTSLVAALCFALTNDDDGGATPIDASDPSSVTSPFPPRQSRQRSIIASLSQIAHCYAQNKIGSGFDVSAACVGSHVYRRFPEAVIQDVLRLLSEAPTDDPSDGLTGSAMRDALRSCIQESWASDCVAGALRFPSDGPLQVILADVAGGSESPAMARQVLQWRTAGVEDPVHWRRLAEINESIAKLFMELLDCPPSDEERAALARTTAEEWRTIQTSSATVGVSRSTICELHEAFKESRHQLKAMGDAAGVPIEPDEQTRLADATMELPGVLAALCPGAGGFDALACVYIQDAEDLVRQKIESFWKQWQHSSVSPLNVRGISYGDGVRVEKCIQ